MHNSFYFLRQISAKLHDQIEGHALVSCFSQNKDELVLEFHDGNAPFFLKCSLLSDIQCLSFPDSFRRARKNSIDLFEVLIMKQVKGVRQFTNERSFALQFDEGYLLTFKMHGMQANVILFHDQRVEAVFRHHLPADRERNPDELDHKMDWQRDTFLANPQETSSRFFTFGKPVWEYLKKRGFDGASPPEKWLMIVETRALLENPVYRIVDDGTHVRLSLLPEENFQKEFSDPLVAVTSFFQRFMSHSSLTRQRKALLTAVRKRISQCSAYLEKNSSRLESSQPYAKWADLLMANLHQLSTGLSEAVVEDIHEPGNLVTIKLKKNLSPQKNAETYYRKSKNQAVEMERLEETRKSKLEELNRWQALEEEIQNAGDRDALQNALNLLRGREQEDQGKVILPYRKHEYKGFVILVGKNAASNDELTLRHTHKDDLWLHARDVAGSHVVIKYQAGKNFPKDVIAHAASLAAFHSQRRNESLCPVAVTTAKYVRKRKGDPPGMVVVQREKVVMAEPAAGTGQGKA